MMNLINVEIDEVSVMMKNEWSSNVRKKLISQIEGKLSSAGSKSRFIMKFGQKPYLTSFNKAITKVILNLRLNMLEIRDNFKNSGTENVCPMCLDEKDSTEHFVGVRFVW